MSDPMEHAPQAHAPAGQDELEDKGLVFGRFSDEDYDGIKEGNGKIPWWLVMIVAVTILEAFLWTMPWPGFGQRYETVTTSFVSASGAQPWWDWGYYLIMLQIIAVMSGIACIVWIINWQKSKESERGGSHGDDA
jgi:N-terminal domain of cytochrome oxidase-cbb3, FixP